MLDRESGSTSFRVTRRRALIAATVVAGGVAMGVTPSLLGEAYIEDPDGAKDLQGEGHVISGYTTPLPKDTDLWVTVGAAGRNLAYPQSGEVEITDGGIHIYRKWKIGATFLEPDQEYDLSLYLVNRLSPDFKEYIAKGTFEPIPNTRLRPERGFVLKDSKTVRRVR